jgi:hypothetical protein
MSFNAKPYSLFLAVVLLVVLAACGQPTPAGTPVSVSPCSLSESNVGQSVTFEGTFTFVHADSEGTYADLESDGCQIGIWVPLEMFESWSAEDQGMLRVGQEATLCGTVRRNEGELVVELSQPPAAPESAPDASPTPTAGQSIQSPCDMTSERVGSSVRVGGTVAFVNGGEPDGTYADLEHQGCRVGVWVAQEGWSEWSDEQRGLFRVGQRVVVEGRLTSFEDKLIVDVTTAPHEAEGPGPDEVDTRPAPDLPPAPESAFLDVLLIYSGLNDMPALCYLGAFSMLVGFNHPEFDFADAVAMGGVGSSALYLDYPEMDPVLTHRYADASIINVVLNLNASYALGFGVDGRGSDPYQPVGMPFETYADGLVRFESGDEALDYLKRAVGSGYPVEVYLNTYFIFDDFAAISTYWREVLGKDNAAHFMTVTGYDAESVYLNDPTDPTDQAGSLSADVQHFLQAWENTLSIPGAQPMGPYWMLFLVEPGEIPEPELVVSWNAEEAEGAFEEIGKFADDPGGSEFAHFMLHEMAKARLEFADYLDRNGWADAGQHYRQSGLMLAELSTGEEMDPDSIEAIARQEEEALALLGAEAQ